MTSSQIFLLKRETYNRWLKDQYVGLRLGFLLEWDKKKRGGFGWDMENPHCLGCGKGGPLVTKKSQLSVIGHTYQNPLPKMGSPYNNVLQLFLMSLRLKPDWIFGCFHQFWVVLKMIILCRCQKKSCIEFCTQRGSHKKFHTMKRKKTLHIKSLHIFSLHIENIHRKWLCFHDSCHWILNFRQHKMKKMKWNINQLPMAMTWNGHLQPPQTIQKNSKIQRTNASETKYWQGQFFYKSSHLIHPCVMAMNLKLMFA